MFHYISPIKEQEPLKESNMQTFPNWQEIEEALFGMGKMAIARFAQEHSNEFCSFFAYAWTIVDGDFSICLDILSNALQAARESEQAAIEQRMQMLRGTQSWRNAHYFLTNLSIIDYASGVDLFTYPRYEHVQVDGWNAFATNEALPKSQSREDTYLEGNVRLVIWRVLEGLLEERLFDSLLLASPFRVGYQFHDQKLVVLRILNWPAQ
jgi:hypothetical protein